MIMTSTAGFARSVRGITGWTVGRIWNKTCMTDMIPGAIRISMTGIRNPKILTSTVRSPMHMRKRNVKLGGSQLTDPITAKSEIRVLENSMEAIPILNQLSDQLEGFELQQGTMDDVFLAVTGKSLKGGNI